MKESKVKKLCKHHHVDADWFIQLHQERKAANDEYYRLENEDGYEALQEAFDKAKAALDANLEEFKKAETASHESDDKYKKYISNLDKEVQEELDDLMMTDEERKERDEHRAEFAAMLAELKIGGKEK